MSKPGVVVCSHVKKTYSVGVREIEVLRDVNLTLSEGELVSIIGPSGSGKTYTSLIFGTALANGQKLALLDTERGSASKYADLFEFDVLELDTYSPERYIGAITAAENAGYDVLIIDSLSHAWEGKEGLLDLHDKIVRRQRIANTFIAWKDVTPLHRALIDAMLQSRCHIIVTMRTKTEWVLEENERGKQVPRRVGTQPIQRKGIEYEFDIVGDMDLNQQLAVSKTRCSALKDERKAVVTEPDAAWFQIVIDWLTEGSEEPEKMRTRKPSPKSSAPKAAGSRSSRTSRQRAGPARPPSAKREPTRIGFERGGRRASRSRRGRKCTVVDHPRFAVGHGITGA